MLPCHPRPVRLILITRMHVPALLLAYCLLALATLARLLIPCTCKSSRVWSIAEWSTPNSDNSWVWWTQHLSPQASPCARQLSTPPFCSVPQLFFHTEFEPSLEGGPCPCSTSPLSCQRCCQCCSIFSVTVLGPRASLCFPVRCNPHHARLLPQKCSAQSVLNISRQQFCGNVSAAVLNAGCLAYLAASDSAE